MIEVTGLGELLAGFAAAEARIAEASHHGLEAAGQTVREAWVHNIETEGLVDTGRYRDSITVERDGAEVKVTSDVPYSPILEHGDSRQAGHYVATRAAEEHHDAVLDAAAEPVGRAL